MLRRTLVAAAAVAALAGAPAPQAGAAPPRIQAVAEMAPSGTVTVRGTVRPANSSWRVRVQRRVTRSQRGRARQVWVRQADSAQLPRNGRFRVSLPASGNSLIVRAVVLSGRRVVATGRTLRVSRPAHTEGAGISSPSASPPVVEPAPPVSPGTSPAPATGSVPAPGTRAELTAGQGLGPGERLTSPNGQYVLTMQAGDGNLVLSKGATTLWTTGASGAGARVVMQSDGNLLVSRSGQATWSSNTAGFDGAKLVIQNDGNVVVHHGGREIWTWSRGYIGSVLDRGQTLPAGAILRSPNGRYRMIMQGDGNLVLYRDGSALWATSTSGAGTRAVMQSDGNLVVYTGSVAKWASTTDGFGGATLSVQDDGNAVIYHNGRGVWTWGSRYIGDRLLPGTSLPPGAYLLSGDHRFSLHMQGDGNLVQYGPSGAVWAWDTAGNPGAHAVMQGDGNFVVYRGSTALRDTGTHGRVGAFLILQNDANLVVYQGGTALWWRTQSRPPSQSHPAAAWAAAQQGKRYADPADAALFSDWAPGPFGEWSGDCAKFAYLAWLKAGKAIARGNAREQYYAYASRVQGGAAPAGALVFWPNVAAPFGHIAISDGAGGVYTTQGLDHANLPIARVPVGHFGAPAGWVMP